MNKYTFPDASEIMKRLTAVDDTGGDVERVFRRFANSMANSQKVAPGVVMGFGMDVYHIATEPMATPMIGAMMHIRFGEYAEALFPDAPEFAQEVIAFHNQVMDDASKANS